MKDIIITKIENLIWPPIELKNILAAIGITAHLLFNFFFYS